jgi:hypothetical protein
MNDRNIQVSDEGICFMTSFLSITLSKWFREQKENETKHFLGHALPINVI